MITRSRERVIENRIISWLIGEYQHSFKIETSGFYDTKINKWRRRNSRIKKGTSDIITFLSLKPLDIPDRIIGMGLAIEVKGTPEDIRRFIYNPDDHEKNQRVFLEKTILTGNIGFVTCSLEHTQELLEPFLKRYYFFNPPKIERQWEFSK